MNYRKIGELIKITQIKVNVKSLDEIEEFQYLEIRIKNDGKIKDK